jgi:hypothetical protein
VFRSYEPPGSGHLVQERVGRKRQAAWSYSRREGRSQDFGAHSAGETAIQHDEQMFGGEGAHQVGELVQWQRRGRQVVHVGVVRDDLVGIAAVAGERDDDHVIRRTGGLQFTEFFAEVGAGGVLVGNEMAVVAVTCTEIVGKERVESAGVPDCGCQVVNVAEA